MIMADIIKCACNLYIFFMIQYNVDTFEGPFTEIVGGNRPFKDNETVTYKCTVYGGEPLPTMQWRCLNFYRTSNITYNGKEISQEIMITLDSKVKMYYQCGCHVEGRNISKLATTAPILFRTKPIMSADTRKEYTAGPDFPVTVRVSYYAYPFSQQVGIFKKNYQPINSAEKRTFYEDSHVTFNWQNHSYSTRDGVTFSWRIDSFKVADYGDYTMKIGNDEGMTDFEFIIKNIGPPSEPFNVSIFDVSSEGFTVTFNPGFNGSFSQSFAINYWRSDKKSKIWKERFNSTKYKVKNLSWNTEYQFVLFAENKLGRSINSVFEPYTVFIKDPSGGSHSLQHIKNGVFGVSAALFVLMMICLLRLYRRPKLNASMDVNVPQRATLNTERGVYIDRAVYQRDNGLPDVHTVDRVSSKKHRRAIKVPPILAVFRKSRCLPNCDDIANIHAAQSRDNSVRVNGSSSTNDNQTEQSVAPSASQGGDLIEQHDVPVVPERRKKINRASTLPDRRLNYPHIEIRDSGTMSRAPIHYQRTNYSEINFGSKEGLSLKQEDDDTEYGRIFFDTDTLPPAAYSEAPTLPIRRYLAN